jgi:hypothetical protein
MNRPPVSEIKVALIRIGRNVCADCRGVPRWYYAVKVHARALPLGYYSRGTELIAYAALCTKCRESDPRLTLVHSEAEMASRSVMASYRRN